MSQELKETKEPAESVSYTYTVPVRFEASGRPYSFGTENAEIHKGDNVVVETQQGLELGTVEADAVAVSKYGLRMPTRPIIRVATSRDLRINEENKRENDRAFAICKQEIEYLKLDMNLLSAQYTLDRSKVLFVYLSEQRVDFRELLKKLGSRLHCRIELRQIGERDKARMVGGIGMCGMECCCRRFKSRFDVISINMAKNQLLALNIDKLSGMCGKLMCCLKYEDNDYKEMTAGLPKMGSQVEYEGEIYRITNMNVMSNEAKLENHENTVFLTLDELREKAIPRKGVVMQHKKDDPNHPVHKNIIHVGQHPEHKEALHTEAAHERPSRNGDGRMASRRRETSGSEPSRNNNRTEVRTFGRRNKNEQAGRPAAKAAPKNTERKPAKNVTVRTFGRRKKEENA
ncbi:MAG: regulatory iron-sulfur-containing complex subunit RicT [Lactimicrobium sp.]|uniref:regulatory iron-sulfur-containing complex subunit RicT n=1 Tax=Lactimicrobium sp. TaxID=2563780 RepID=UPI002F35F712